ncbi:BTAD domain-containing putative transcriptional regulator [Nonomuraea fuscirosea]|uniref:AfsR/SARP family transcriptional regulator n=1 Tax=Nonomuraea fuscirosea TaxID=1291556 RepID=UPI003446A6F0
MTGKHDLPHFRVLGPLDCNWNGRSVALGGPRQHKVLAVLLLSANVEVSFDRLVDVLWDRPPMSARQQIHNVIAALRRSLAVMGDEVEIVRGDTGYRIRVPESWIDAFRFRALLREALHEKGSGSLAETVRKVEHALALWRGPALAGLTSQLLMNVAARLDEERLAAVEHLMATRVALGEAGSVAGELMELVTDHPLRESLRNTLMMALYQTGRQADALAVYEQGRQLLAAELGLDPSPQLKATHALILNGEAGPTGSGVAQTDQASRTSSAGRSYLPHDTADFTGRMAEVLHLLSAAKQNSATALVISAIEGMGGIGKTTLAIHIAHELARDYPDGQYFIDLHGFSTLAEPLPPSRALEILLRDSGSPPELMPPDLEGRSAMWRSRTAGQRALLVLDNAVDAAQVRPLLPSSSDMIVLITSRRRLTSIEGAVPLSLDVLPLEDAIALFNQVVGAGRTATEREAVISAVNFCGRLPLAVRIAAARLRDRTSWTVTYLVDQLADHERRIKFLAAGDRSVRGALTVSYRYLTEKQRRLFRLLSLHPGADFDTSAAVAVTGDLPEQVESDLEVLFEDHLLQQNAPGRFAFHDLVRDCAYALLREEEPERAHEEARRRIVSFYLRTAYEWCRPLARGTYLSEVSAEDVGIAIRRPGSQEEAVRLLDREYMNFVTAAWLAINSRWNVQAWQLICCLQPYFSLRNYDGEAHELFTAAWEAAREIGDRYGESACLMGLASVHRTRGGNEKAAELTLRAIEISREIGDQGSETYQLINLAIMYANDDKFLQARDYLISAEKIAVSNGDDSARAVLANNLAVICRLLGQFEDAHEYFQQALVLNSSKGPSASRALTMSGISFLRHTQGDHRAAIEGFTVALTLSRSISDQYSQAFALVGLSAANRSIGELTLAIDNGRKALELSRQASLYDLECEALTTLGDAFASSGDLDVAERLFRQAADLARDHGVSRYLAAAQAGLAHVETARGNHSDAHEYWSLALETYPPGLVEAQAVRRHLEPGDSPVVSCLRCGISP